MNALVRFEINVPAAAHFDGERFISSCELLGVMSQGETEKVALDNLVEAIQGFLETCFEMGTLDEVLKECGFHAHAPSGLAPSPDWLKVPLELVTNHAAERANHCS